MGRPWLLLAKISLLALTLLLPCALSEFYIRSSRPEHFYPLMGDYYQIDPLLSGRNFFFYTFIPNMSRSIKGPSDRPVPLRTNRLGLRGPEIGPKQDELRILMVGDSFTAGITLPEEETYVGLLAESLGKSLPGRRVRCINAGVPSWDLLRGWTFLKANIDRLEPDVVLVQIFVGNDVIDYTPFTAWNPRPFAERAADFMASRSLYARLLIQTVYALRRKMGPSAPPSSPVQPVPAKAGAPPSIETLKKRAAPFGLGLQDPELVFLWNDQMSDLGLFRKTAEDPAYRATFLMMEELLRVGEARRIPVWFYLVPTKRQVVDLDLKAAAAMTRSRMDSREAANPQRILTAYAAKRNWTLFDPTPALREAAGRSRVYWRADAHLNKEGSQAMAEFLSARILGAFEASGGIPSSDR